MNYKISLLAFSCLIFVSGSLAAQDNEYEELGEKISATLNDRNADFLNEKLDVDLIIDKVVIKSGSAEHEQFNQGFKKGLKNKFNFGQVLVKALGDDGIFTFLKYHKKEGSDYLLFSIYSSAGLNYYDFHAVKSANGLRLVDCYVFISGENLSESLKRGYLAILPADFGADEFKQLKPRLEQYSKLANIQSLRGQGKDSEALELFNNISPEVRKEKMFQLIHIGIAKNLSDDLYLKAILEYEALYPGDASLALVSIDGHILQKNYSKALQSIDQLEKSLGVRDPMLDFLRGNAHFMNNDFKRAELAFESTIEELPAMEEAYWLLAITHITSKEYSSAVNTLDRICKTFERSKQEINTALADSSEFLSSTSYKQWLEK